MRPRSVFWCWSPSSSNTHNIRSHDVEYVPMDGSVITVQNTNNLTEVIAHAHSVPFLYTHTQIQMHTAANTYTQMLIPMTHSCTHAHTRTYPLLYTHTNTNAHGHKHIHPNANFNDALMHTCTHTHVPPSQFNLESGLAVWGVTWSEMCWSSARIKMGNPADLMTQICGSNAHFNRVQQASENTLYASSRDLSALLIFSCS